MWTYFSNWSTISEPYASSPGSPLAVFENQGSRTVRFIRWLSTVWVYIFVSTHVETRVGHFKRLHRQFKPISDARICCLNQILHLTLINNLRTIHFQSRLFAMGFRKPGITHSVAYTVIIHRVSLHFRVNGCGDTYWGFQTAQQTIQTYFVYLDLLSQSDITFQIDQQFQNHMLPVMILL